MGIKDIFTYFNRKRKPKTRDNPALYRAPSLRDGLEKAPGESVQNAQAMLETPNDQECLATAERHRGYKGKRKNKTPNDQDDLSTERRYFRHKGKGRKMGQSDPNAQTILETPNDHNGLATAEGQSDPNAQTILEGQSDPNAQTILDPVPRSKYLDYFDQYSAANNAKFEEQFTIIGYRNEMIKENEQLTTHIGLELENLTCNRFPNVIPYDQRRVVLGCRGTSTAEPKPKDYINASFIYHFPPCTEGQTEIDFERIDYIAAQGPLERTRGDFWRMVLEQEASVIVMLTNLQENGRTTCAQYWPENGGDTEEYTSGDVSIQVKMVKQEVNTDLIERKFHVRNLTDQQPTVEVRHLQITSWPDQGVLDISKFEEFLEIYDQLLSKCRKPGPTVVHCRAGVGRTGTFIATDVLRRHLKEPEAQVDIPGIVIKLRRCRPIMVDNLDQYLFLHSYAKRWLERESS